jgi:flavorubredoxin
MVKENDTLYTGRHTLQFLMAPMVHWPEVMVTFDQTTGTMFSADAFGTFGALGGSIFADQLPIGEWEDEYRRYYTNIVGKYGPLVQALLKKAARLEIKTICPLHGPVWRENLDWLLHRYDLWSSYTAEADAVSIFVGSIYGNTENAAEVLATLLQQRGARDVRVFNTSNVHLSDLVAEAFRASHLVFASATYNGQIFTPMEELLKDLVVHNLQNRTVALVENGSWGPTAGRQMKELVEKMKNMNLVGDLITVKSALKPEQLPALEALADAIMANYPMPL